jgi:N6-L-threonylcarbamoyladenine synthase
MEAHALTARLPSLGLSPPMTFPALVLLASGGHNMLVLCEGIGRHRIIGTTLDDSAGECFDKIARLLGITAIPGRSGLDLGCMSAWWTALSSDCSYTVLPAPGL